MHSATVFFALCAVATVSAGGLGLGLGGAVLAPATLSAHSTVINHPGTIHVAAAPALVGVRGVGLGGLGLGVGGLGVGGLGLAGYGGVGLAGVGGLGWGGVGLARGTVSAQSSVIAHPPTVRVAPVLAGGLGLNGLGWGR